MADNEQTEDGAAAEAASAPKSKRKLIIVAAAVLLLLGAGGGGWFFFFNHHGEEKHAEAPAPKPPVFVDVPDILVNLAGLPGERVLCTQDHFRMDDEGFLYFVGRTDDIIKTRGEKVSPVEVENVLHAIPGVREAAVVGIPDDVLGQAIRAYVVLNAGVALGGREIRAQCAAKLENFMVPRDVVLCGDLPRTATGKVSRKALLENPPA